jgi:hypothetical protein
MLKAVEILSALIILNLDNFVEGQKVFSESETGDIPSRVAIAGQDGTFFIMLPAGYYFLIAQSNRSKLENAYAPVRISEGEITQIFFEMTFLDESGKVLGSPFIFEPEQRVFPFLNRGPRLPATYRFPYLKSRESRQGYTDCAPP